MEEVRDLRVEVRDLMFHFEAAQKLSEGKAEGRLDEEDVEGASLQVPPSPKHNRRRKKK